MKKELFKGDKKYFLEYIVPETGDSPYATVNFLPGHQMRIEPYLDLLDDDFKKFIDAVVSDVFFLLRATADENMLYTDDPLKINYEMFKSFELFSGYGIPPAMSAFYAVMIGSSDRTRNLLNAITEFSMPIQMNSDTFMTTFDYAIGIQKKVSEDFFERIMSQCRYSFSDLILYVESLSKMSEKALDALSIVESESLQVIMELIQEMTTPQGYLRSDTYRDIPIPYDFIVELLSSVPKDSWARIIASEPVRFEGDLSAPYLNNLEYISTLKASQKFDFYRIVIAVFLETHSKESLEDAMQIILDSCFVKGKADKYPNSKKFMVDSNYSIFHLLAIASYLSDDEIEILPKMIWSIYGM